VPSLEPASAWLPEKDHCPVMLSNQENNVSYWLQQ
jgi:hypothetical protein